MNSEYMSEDPVLTNHIGCGQYEGLIEMGATNITNSVGYIKHIMREEWGFTGIVTTDMGRGSAYHETSALIMATVNQLAGNGHAYIGESGLDLNQF